jgi:hypothetical protein
VVSLERVERKSVGNLSHAEPHVVGEPEFETLLKLLQQVMFRDLELE